MSSKKQRWNYKRIAIFLIFFLVMVFVLISLLSKIINLITKNDKSTDNNKITSSDMKNNSASEDMDVEAMNIGDSIWNIKFEEEYFSYENTMPVSYTIDEVRNILDKLSSLNDDFKIIYENIDVCPEDLLISLVNNMELKGYVEGYISDELNKSDNVIDNTSESNMQEDLLDYNISTIIYKGHNYTNKSDYPLILQWDQRWGYYTYGQSNIAVSGCGPTCLAMIIKYLKPEDTSTLIDIANYCNDNGYYVYGSGTEWRTMREVPELYGISVEELPLVETYINNSLDDNRVLICSVSQGDFTRDGHYIVIYGYDENGYYINDPNSIRKSLKQWSFQQMEGQISNIWSYYIKD